MHSVHRAPSEPPGSVDRALSLERTVSVADVASFFEAVAGGDRDRVASLLEDDPRLVDARDEEGRTPLLVAIYHGHHELVNDLTEGRPSTDILEAAASGDAARVLELLREEPRRVDYASTDGFSPLGLASFFGHPDVVEILLRFGADPNRRSRNAMKVAPIHSAAAHRDPETSLEVCRRLLTAGGDPDRAQAGGWRPLHQAAANGNEVLVRLLLGRGADAGARSDDGRTSADMARKNGHPDLATLLLSAEGGGSAVRG